MRPKAGEGCWTLVATQWRGALLGGAPQKPLITHQKALLGQSITQSSSTGRTTLFLPQQCSVGLVRQPGHGAASMQPKGTVVHSRSLEAEALGLGSRKQRQASRPGHLGKPRGHSPVWLWSGLSGPWQGQIYIFTGLFSSSVTAGLKKSLHFNPRSHC